MPVKAFTTGAAPGAAPGRTLGAVTAHAETYTDGGGGKTFAVGQPRAGLDSIAPGIYNVRLRDPNHMTSYGGQWSTCQTLLCGPGYEDNIDPMGIVLPQNSSGVLRARTPRPCSWRPPPRSATPPA
jgi:hypothetical protein